jgi:hypothetical protein
MTIATAKNTPRNTYTATGGQTVFTIGFEFFNTTDIKVFRNGTQLTYNASPSSVSQFSVQGTSNASDSAYEFGAGGTITLGSGATASDSIVIVRDIIVERTTDFTPAASFDVTALNTQLDTLMAMMAEREESTSRSIRLPLSETTTVFDMELPVLADRQNKILEFDANGDPACTITAANLSTLGTITSDITTVAGISANVTTVAGISSNVTTVAGIASDVTSVAAKASFITADFVADLNTLAVTDIVNDINLLATSDIVSDLNTLATSDIISDLNTLATSDIVSDLNTLATSDIVTDLNILATTDNVTNMATLGASGVVANIATVSTDITNVNTVATNITGVNSFAERYRVGSSDPASSLDEGDLFYNSTDNEVKYYNGSAWQSITAGIANVVEDTTPQLGGNLDLNSNNITGTGDLNFTGSITLTGNVDGRDVSTDGTKLDGIATSATANPNAIDNVVEDTTPQLGGDLDTNSNHIYTADGGIVTRQNNKPLIINGDMHIHQRTTSKTGITSTGLDVQDRFSRVMGGAGTWTQTSDTDVPTGQGFTKSMKWDCTTAATLTDPGQIFSVRYIWEGQDLQLLKYGSSNAEKLTVAFWIKSPKTGTHIVSLYAHDDNRHVSKAYTIASANTWEKHVCSFPGDTTGVIDNDNGHGISLEIGLSAGSNYTSGTLATSWASYTAANSYVGQVNCADNTANNIFITGVQVEVGEYDATTIPAFQHETFADSKTRCQRYFIGDSELVPTAQATSASVIQGLPQFRTEMRASPTVTAVATGGFGLIGGSFNTTTLVTSTMGVNGGRYIVNHDSSIGINQFVQCGLPCTLDAEL